MATNPFFEKMREICREEFKVEGAAFLEKGIEARVEELINQLVPIEVARQLHKVLAGEPLAPVKNGGGGVVGAQLSLFARGLVIGAAAARNAERPPASKSRRTTR